MADEKRFLDIWTREDNKLYREVPYAVVADWVQQGRLLEDDQLKPSGTAEWTPLGQIAEFAIYLPQADPFRAEDQAEALEPVEMEIAWKHPRGDEDEDVDMIPLIDVSLVLLIFFMMTATLASAGSWISTPEARHGHLLTTESLWVGVERDASGRPFYSIGLGSGGIQDGDRNLTFERLLDRLDAKLGEAGRVPVATIKADRGLPAGVIKQLRAALDVRRIRGLIGSVGDEVSERQTQ